MGLLPVIPLTQAAIVFAFGSATNGFDASAIVSGIISGIFLLINTLLILYIKNRGKDDYYEYEDDEEGLEDYDHRRRKRSRPRRVERRRKKKEPGGTGTSPGSGDNDS